MRQTLHKKQWRIAQQFPPELKSRYPHLSDIELQLLHNRGIIDEAAVEEFLRAEFDSHVYDPALLKDAMKAVKRIQRAIKRGEKMLIFGDFDTDGVTASVILKKTFEFLGVAVDVYIPDREKESHGLRKESIAAIAATGVKLIMTVDCGVSNVEEVAYAKTLGVDVIITDHHEVPAVLPSAAAVVNPKRADDSYPCKVLCGAGVAFKLAQLLLKQSGRPAQEQIHMQKWLLDIVAIGTIGDCVPLRGENRTLVKYGLIVLNKTRRPGIRAILASAHTEEGGLSSTDVSFRIVPRINAAGRLQHADLAFRLLYTDNDSEARILAAKLNSLNSERQTLTERVSEEARAQLLALGDATILWAIGDATWPAGINGIVASKMMDEFHRPVIIMQRREQETVASGRSIPEFDITRAITQGKHLLTRFGGHPGACGFSLKNEYVDEFVSLLQEFARKEFTDGLIAPHIPIEAVLDAEHIGWELFTKVQQFQPFGQDNQEPTFLFRALKVSDIRVMGKKSEHIKLFFQTPGTPHGRVAAVAFHAAERLKPVTVGSELDVVSRLRVNEWNGERNLELELVDAEFSGLIGTAPAASAQRKKKSVSLLTGASS